VGDIPPGLRLVALCMLLYQERESPARTELPVDPSSSSSSSSSDSDSSPLVLLLPCRPAGRSPPIDLD
jgi:hypothetical protein